jgi:monoamine oxidase
MSRTPLFRTLRRLAQAAHAARRADLPADEILDAAYARRCLTRRDFLHASAAALGAAAVTPVLGAGAGCGGGGGGGGGRDAPKIAIVGAGMAGLHCAYRLKQAGLVARVFEASSRPGGRMYTARGMFADEQLAELGGELIDSNHATMIGLASELGLVLDDLTADLTPAIERERFWFGGRAVTEQEIVAAFTPLAAHMAEAVTAAEADEAEFERLDALGMRAWLDGFGDTGPLVKSLLDVAYTGEYGLEINEQSVFNLLYLIDYEEPDPFRIFGDSDERFHTHVGNDALTSGLAERLTGQIETDMRLARITSVAGGRLRLAFEHAATTREEDFDHVVIAIPFTTLREVDVQVELPQDKRDVIAQLGYGTNTKLMAQFTSRVWRAAHQTSGSFFTDNGAQAGWDTSRGQAGAAGLLTNFLGGDAGVAAGQGTPEERALAALPRLDEVFPGVQQAYRAGSAVRMHWPGAPLFKGSYACYRPGQWAFYGVEGRREGNLHFCGEHCSLDFQGFMEGACETGAAVAATLVEELRAPPAVAYLTLAGPPALRRARLRARRLALATRARARGW